VVERYRPVADNVTNLPHSPASNAERQRRFKARRKAEKAAAVAAASLPAPVTAPVTTTGAVAAQPGNALPLTLPAALAIATVQGGMAIFGLTSVFSGAFWPVISMGVALEFGKLSAIAWLGHGHGTGPFRIVMTTLVAMLMALSSTGSFGFLSNAHIARVTADRATVDSRAADVAARANVQAGALADIDKRIAQIDDMVREATSRGRTKAAVSLLDEQEKRRAALVSERSRMSLVLAGIEIEQTRIQIDRDKLAAANGPITYLSALIGAQPDDVMRWFILVVSFLLDPLAAVLLLAATYSRSTPS
jgi:hypothetical protein